MNKKVEKVENKSEKLAEDKETGIEKNQQNEKKRWEGVLRSNKGTKTRKNKTIKEITKKTTKLSADKIRTIRIEKTRKIETRQITIKVKTRKNTKEENKIVNRGKSDEITEDKKELSEKDNKISERCKSSGINQKNKNKTKEIDDKALSTKDTKKLSNRNSNRNSESKNEIKDKNTNGLSEIKKEIKDKNTKRLSEIKRDRNTKRLSEIKKDRNTKRLSEIKRDRNTKRLSEIKKDRNTKGLSGIKRDRNTKRLNESVNNKGDKNKIFNKEIERNRIENMGMLEKLIKILKKRREKRGTQENRKRWRGIIKRNKRINIKRNKENEKSEETEIARWDENSKLMGIEKYNKEYLTEWKETEKVILYVLKCTNNKYYIGKSRDFCKRLIQHSNGKGAEWTKRYKPIQVEEIYISNDGYDEDDLTLKIMKKQGIKNVRGGSFVKYSLENNDIGGIKKLLKYQYDNISHELKYKLKCSAYDMCFNCGSYGHFGLNCTKYE